jgi:hypothetical protein
VVWSEKGARTAMGDGERLLATCWPNRNSVNITTSTCAPAQEFPCGGQAGVRGTASTTWQWHRPRVVAWGVHAPSPNASRYVEKGSTAAASRSRCEQSAVRLSYSRSAAAALSC